MGTTIYILLCFFIISNSLCQVLNNEGVAKDSGSLKLCEVCVCSEISDPEDARTNVEQKRFVFNILCSELDRIQNVTDLHRIQWPENKNKLAILATFDGLHISTLGKLPSNALVESLKFPNNAIEVYWPEPLRLLPNLRRLSFASNQLSSINFDMFSGVTLLEDLDLSDNRISDINVLCFQNLNNLKRINLQNNQLLAVPIEALLPLAALEDLDLSRNKIHDLMLMTGSDDGLTGLKRMSLRGNQIRTVMENSFPDDNNLEFLDLAENKIELIEEQSFLSCTKLKELKLENNNITLVFQLPANLEACNLRMNSMHHWPSFPNGIKFVDLSYNRIETLYNDETDFNNLEALYLSGNQIKEFYIARTLPNLYTLDLSYNELQEIPKQISEQYFPSLDELWLDGNPLQRIYFPNVIVLRKLHLNYIPKLVNVEEKAFTNVAGAGIIAGGKEEGDEDEKMKCFDLYLSKCQSLSAIHENAFEGTALCMLDISSNNLTALPKGLLPWASVAEGGVNLQHNPWHCGCEMQWVLDELMPILYKSQDYLLEDVRCGSPRAVEQLRLVHWYNWTDLSLCTDYLNRSGPQLAASIENPFTNMSLMTILLSAAILFLTLVAMGLIIYLVITRKKYRIRTAAARRRKQAAEDINKNGHSEQLKALNKT